VQNVVSELVEIAYRSASELCRFFDDTVQSKTTARANEIIGKGLIAAVKAAPENSARACRQQLAKKVRKVRTFVDPDFPNGTSCWKSSPGIEK
jgi:hypothetical protein